jgi:hypothetical protein
MPISARMGQEFPPDKDDGNALRHRPVAGERVVARIGGYASLARQGRHCEG